jgi:hypothetical protein
VIRRLLALVAVLPLLASCGRRAAPSPSVTKAPAGAGPLVPKPFVGSRAGGPTVEGLVCFECHNVLGQEGPRGIRFDHKAHGQLTHCGTCHGADDHHAKPPDAAPHTFGVSRACHTCHDGQKAPDTCRTCHADMTSIEPASHQRADFVRSHGKDKSTPACAGCHQSAWCASCHGLPIPHAADFFAGHGKQAQRTPKVCGQCHEPAKCTACHNGLPMPHPPTFRAEHGQIDSHLCGKCHEKSFCSACHAKTNPHPRNWLAVHGRGGMNGALKCTICHERSYCDRCHGLAMPHPLNWTSSHGPTAKRQGALCAKCHESTRCASCHGLPMPHPASWAKKHGAAALRDRVICGRCHTESQCRACHGLAMPHPPGFVQGHNGEGTFASGGTCRKCHAVSFCRQCHDSGG